MVAPEILWALVSLNTAKSMPDRDIVLLYHSKSECQAAAKALNLSKNLVCIAAVKVPPPDDGYDAKAHESRYP